MGLYYWPDGTMGFLRNGTGVDTYAASSGLVSKVEHDIARGTFRPVYATRAIQNLRVKFDYAGGGPVIRQADGSVLLMYHAERHRNGDSKQYYSTLGIAKSKDNGATFVDLGEAITPNLPFSSASGSNEIGGGGFVSFNSSIYTYFRDSLKNGTTNTLAIARASGSNPGTTAEWKKSFQGGFTEPGIGGLSTAMNSSAMTPIWFSVAFCQYTGLLAMAYVQARDAEHWELRLAWSKDGFSWSPSKTIEADVKESMYPSLLGVSGDAATLGRSFYVYYTASEVGSWSRWQDAALTRRKITVV